MTAERLHGIGVSASAIMTDRVTALKAEGHRIIGLSSGEPDFPTPVHAITAAFTAAEAGDTKYPPMDGKSALKKAVQRKFRRENNLDYSLDEILIGNGAKQIIYDAMQASVSPGDEVILPTPAWISYADIARLAGGTVVSVPCPAETGFKLQPDDLEHAITPKTRWLALNFPSNPTGTCCTWDEMKALADVIMRHPHVWVMMDDIYEHLIYDNFTFCTMAEVEPRLKDRVLTINGLSKAYAMTGWRVGYCGGPKSLIHDMNNMQGQSTGGINTLAQAAGIAALDGPQDYIKERAADYAERRDLALSILNNITGVSCHRPEGAFYLFPNIAPLIGRTTAGGRLIETDGDFVLALLDEHGVATVQGSAYGMSPFFRISYATDRDTLREGCERIAAFVAGMT